MGTLDKEKGEFNRRTPHTVAPFPELNSEALGWVYQRLVSGLPSDLYVPKDEEALRSKDRLIKLLQKKDFAGLYAMGLVETSGELDKSSIDGEWRTYYKDSDYHKLEADLAGKGTGWCTATGSAHAHLQGGDFHVFYSKGKDGQYTEPRIAIRMENNQVSEVRGINHRQELEPVLIDEAKKQYASLPGGERFVKKSADMKRVTALATKLERGESFTKDDLIFLYEINSTIEGFGYQQDPRIQELRKDRNIIRDIQTIYGFNFANLGKNELTFIYDVGSKRTPTVFLKVVKQFLQGRNIEQDMLIIFDCDPSQVAHTFEEINSATKAYVGNLEPGVFDRIQQFDIEHIYTNFPEGRITLETDFKNSASDAAELRQTIDSKGGKVWPGAEAMMERPEFTIKEESFTLVRLSVNDLFGDGRHHTTSEIIGTEENNFTDGIITKLGLELCPPATGPNWRIKHMDDQPMNDYVYVGMKPIKVADGNPCVFFVDHDENGRYLRNVWALPEDEWEPDLRLLFRLRKSVKPLDTSDPLRD